MGLLVLTGLVNAALYVKGVRAVISDRILTKNIALLANRCGSIIKLSC